MDSLELCRELAIIIVAAKFFGLVARKLRAPQVAGEIVAGLLIGPSVLNLVQSSDFMSALAEIGVILLMFSAGLGTNLQDLKRTGARAFLIACAGVFIPLICGAILYMSFYGFASVGTEEFYKAIFIGTILTATSVSITVQALKELGKLNGEVGQTILSAAIIDDVIGILVLTIVIGFKDPSTNFGKVLMDTGLFFVFAVGAGILINKVFQWVTPAGRTRSESRFLHWHWHSHFLILRSTSSALQTSQELIVPVLSSAPLGIPPTSTARQTSSPTCCLGRSSSPPSDCRPISAS